MCTEGERELGVCDGAKPLSRRPWDGSCVARRDLHVVG